MASCRPVLSHSLFSLLRCCFQLELFTIYDSLSPYECKHNFHLFKQFSYLNCIKKGPRDKHAGPLVFYAASPSAGASGVGVSTGAGVGSGCGTGVGASGVGVSTGAGVAAGAVPTYTIAGNAA